MIEKLGIGEWEIEERLDGQEYRIYHEDKFIVSTTDKKTADLIVQTPTMLLWIYQMMDCAERNDMCTAARLLELGPDLIEKATGLTWAEVKERIDEN